MKPAKNLFIKRIPREIVLHLNGNPPKPYLQKMALRVDCTISSLIKNIKILEEAGIVIKLSERAKKDRRNKPYKLTDKGREVARCLRRLKENGL